MFSFLFFQQKSEFDMSRPSGDEIAALLKKYNKMKSWFAYPSDAMVSLTAFYEELKDKNDILNEKALFWLVTFVQVQKRLNLFDDLSLEIIEDIEELIKPLLGYRDVTSSNFEEDINNIYRFNYPEAKLLCKAITSLNLDYHVNLNKDLLVKFKNTLVNEMIKGNESFVKFIANNNEAKLSLTTLQQLFELHTKANKNDILAPIYCIDNVKAFMEIVNDIYMFNKTMRTPARKNKLFATISELMTAEDETKKTFSHAIQKRKFIQDQCEKMREDAIKSFVNAKLKAFAAEKEDAQLSSSSSTSKYTSLRTVTFHSQLNTSETTSDESPQIGSPLLKTPR